MNYGEITSRPDGTYVITHNGMPYHVIPDDPMFAAVDAYAKAYPASVQPEPQPEPPTLEELEARREAEIQASLRELDLQLIRPMAAIVAGTATADDETMFAELIGQKTSLRNELHNVKLKDS